MGMDLVPVYDRDERPSETNPGIITVSANVINRLGVRTALVERKVLEQEIVTVAQVRYDENKLVHIHPRVSGWVEELFVTASGDPVKQNSPLYSLYSPELVNAQEELVLALNRGSARLVKAAENRLKSLHVPKDFIEKLKRTEAVKQTVTFYSPQNGVVENLSIREGFYVQPGTTLFSIASLAQVWVEAEVFGAQVSWVKEGAKASMTLDYYPGVTWEGGVEYIYPSVNENTRTVRVRIPIENTDNMLLPNMHGQVTIYQAHDEVRLLIPREALIRTADQDRVVLALGEGRFKSIAVKVGKSNPNWVEVLHGLREGDKIVSSAHFLLDSESSVSSDFMRMEGGDDTSVQSAEVSGLINRVDLQNRVLNISRGPIAKWDRPAATLDFKVSEEVNISKLSVNDEIYFVFEISEDEFSIVDILQRNKEKGSSIKVRHSEEHSMHRMNKEAAE